MNEAIGRYREQFAARLDGLLKEETLAWALGLLSEGKVTVRELYEEVIAPALNGIRIGRADEPHEIWREHLQTNIARAVVECAHPFVAREREKAAPAGRTKKAMVLCPEEEYHELGARMGADFFAMAGFDVFFIGANTPKDNFLSAYEALRPDVVAISVSNCFNLVLLQKTVRALREKAGNRAVIAVSGGAIARAGKTERDFGADCIISTFEDVRALGEGIV